MSDRVRWEDKVGPEALTFDDVLLVPAHSDVHPREVDVSTRFSRRIPLNVPVVSSAMATVSRWAASVTAYGRNPASAGRNFQEIMRLLIALQTADKFGVATPANWQPGDDVIVPPPGSCGTAQERVAGKQEGVKCLDWFMCLKEVPKDQFDLPPIWK